MPTILDRIWIYNLHYYQAFASMASICCLLELNSYSPNSSYQIVTSILGSICDLIQSFLNLLYLCYAIYFLRLPQEQVGPSYVSHKSIYLDL